MNKSTQGSTAAEYKTETITLKRHDKKKWQYEDCEVTRVEWAVIDYLKTKGWKGYFTEHFNFDNPILVVMCWCNHDKFLKEKRKGLGFGGSTYRWLGCTRG